ncbi:MAG: ribonuclease PH [Phycisphaerae bacterium]
MAQRAPEQLREIVVTRRFTATPAGSVLWQQGETVVLVTASITRGVPPWFSPDKPGGWVTAEYTMLPGSTPTRKAWPKSGHTDSRGTEIQRLIGRCLRGIIDLTKIGPNGIHLDCHVLQADGGTRTACISAAYVALVDALAKLPPALPTEDVVNAPHYDPKAAVIDQLSAVSVGIVDGRIYTDLDYVLDSRAEVDMNIAFTASGKFVEVQGSAEGLGGFTPEQLTGLLEAGTAGCRALHEVQRNALGA